ncbi:MAG: M15 family metallopeptidase, partial [Ruthenibacterium sp.]
AGAPAQGFDDFFAAQPEDAPIYTDAAFSGAAFVGDTGAQESTPVQNANEFYGVQPDAATAQPQFDNAFVGDGFAMDAQDGLPVNEAPFDIAVPEQTAAASSVETQPQMFQSTQGEYVEKRKYTPVFTQPIPSALDELRAGLVKPASPISSVAATQVPVVITAADAAAAEAAAREAAQRAAAEAALAEAAELAEAERAAAEAEASRYGYEDPTPEQTGFGYSAPAQGGDYFYGTPAQGGLSADEFNLPVTEDSSEQIWDAPAEGTAPVEDAFASAYEDQPAAPALFDYDNAPVEGAADVQQGQPALFDYDNEPVQDKFAPYAEETPEPQSAAQTPEDYANNLQAMFGNDDTYAALDAAQPQDFGAQQGYDVQPDEEAAFESEENYAPDGEYTPEGEYAPDDTFGGNFAGLAMTDDGDQMGDAPAFNPFQSDEWLGDDGDDADDAPKKKGHNYSDDMRDGTPHGKKKKNGGGNGKLPLIIVLVLLVAAIVGVLAYLLLSGKLGKQPEISSVSVAPVPVSSVSVAPSVPEAPAVDPIPRDEWYMRVANKATPLPAEFKIETANCKDGIPVDARIVDALNKMVSDGNATGLKLKVVSGYRTYERQKTNYEAQVKKMLAAGKSQADAEAAAGLISAPPGASEHNLGLGMDIMSKSYTTYDEGYAATNEAKWLLENAANYGFILRYPKGSEAITGFEYEPWHYRYVGVDQAQRIKASGLTLEEYVAQDAPTGIPEQSSAATDAGAETGSSSSSAASAAA